MKSYRTYKKNKSILRHSKERHNAFTEEINKIFWSSNDDKKCNQLIR